MAHSHHSHSHSAVSDSSSQGEAQNKRYKETVRVTLIGSVIDLLLGVGKIAMGIVDNSQALIADGVHSLSDLATDFVVLYAAKHSSQGADADHPYGHGRIETVATVGLGVALVIVAIGIAVEAAQRMLAPESLAVPGFWALVIAAISVISKEGIYQYTMIVARRHRSKMLEANAWHSRSDAISSVVVVVGIAGSMAGYHYLDGVAAIGVALMIAKIGWDLCFHSIKELVDTALSEERVEAIKASILSVDGVVSLHILRTRSMGADALVDVHIQVAPKISVSEAHHISETVRQNVIREIDEVADVMVHIDPEDDEDLEFSMRLPLRMEVTARLEKYCANISAAKHINKMILHYLDGKIRVELVLPLSELDNNQKPEQLQSQFDEAIKADKEIDSISLCFR
ncbi:MAG: cation diffusion facilitator family transporter [Gammaproteobacteria bacterium]|nr:cation diffusion facilitator family transporter [Gammaproteobacteria bacterium]